eukprot:491360-Pleurochrysis_carterae.AAC.7
MAKVTYQSYWVSRGVHTDSYAKAVDVIRARHALRPHKSQGNRNKKKATKKIRNRIGTLRNVLTIGLRINKIINSFSSTPEICSMGWMAIRAIVPVRGRWAAFSPKCVT